MHLRHQLVVGELAQDDLVVSSAIGLLHADTAAPSSPPYADPAKKPRREATCRGSATDSAPRRGAALADVPLYVLACRAMIGDESDRVAEEARRGRGAASNRVGRFEPYARVGGRRRLGPRGGAARRSAPRWRSSGRAASSPATPRRTSASTARSTPTAAASTAASTASPGRATPISGSRPGSTSRPGSSRRPEAPTVLAAELARRGLQAGADRDRHQHRPLPADREAASASCAASSRCCATSATR